MMLIDNIDEREARRIHDGSFPFPNLSNPSYIVQRTAIDNGNIVAHVIVKLTAEGILITDQSLPLVTRARCARELMNSAERPLKARNLDDCHVFCKDSHVIDFLTHYGFERCKGGDA